MKMKTQHIKSHEWKLLSRVQLRDPVNYTVHGILQARIQEWVAFPFSIGSSQPGVEARFAALQMDFYQLSHKKRPRILEWVAYPFSRESFPPRNRIGVSCIAGRFFTNQAMTGYP